MTTETDSGEQPAIADETTVIETEVPADAAPAVDDADDSSEPKGPKNPEFQKRIDKLTWEKRQTERDRDYWREQAQRATPAKPEAAESDKPVVRPKLEQFNFDEEAYEAALEKYYDAKAELLVEAKLQKREEEKTQRERAKTWEKRETEFRSKTPDYEEVAYDRSAPINAIMAKLIRESEIGPEVAYYLGKNREIAAGIYELDAVSAAREIGKIEARLSEPAKPPAPVPAPKPVSKAPPPPPKIEASDAAPRVSTTSPDSDSMSDDEWVKAEKARLTRKVKRNG